jgi:hypothetical protein
MDMDSLLAKEVELLARLGVCEEQIARLAAVPDKLKRLKAIHDYVEKRSLDFLRLHGHDQEIPAELMTQVTNALEYEYDISEYRTTSQAPMG